MGVTWKEQDERKQNRDSQNLWEQKWKEGVAAGMISA